MLQSSSVSPLDSDPLLCFETEHEVSPESPEPVVETRTSPDNVEAAEVVAPLNDRVVALERALAASNAEVALLRSDVATLVRAVDDIRTRHRRPTAAALPTQPNVRRITSVIAGVVIVVVTGGWLWMSNRASAEPAAPPAPALSALAAVEPPLITVPAGAMSAPEPAAPAPGASPRKPRAETANPAPAVYVGTLSIDSDPGGDVFIDRRSAGRTPLRLEKLKAGSHLVWIEREGYQRWTRVVQVPADRVSRVWADLDPITSR